MHVLNNLTGKKISVTISKVEAAEIVQINKTKRFNFNWNNEKQYKVYKLTADSIEEPLGLMSLEEMPTDYAIKIRLLASSKENVGKKQEYKRVAGCLIAFACKEAFIAGYEGFVCLKPKTNLKAHYINKYGLQSTKLYLVTKGRNSLRLIKEYYED